MKHCISHSWGDGTKQHDDHFKESSLIKLTERHLSLLLKITAVVL